MSIKYKAHTEQAFENFKVSKETVSLEFIYALTLIKKCAAITNHNLGKLSIEKANAIIESCDEILNKQHDDQFIVDKFQGGAGTSTNMNVNEVIATLASFKCNQEVLPLKDVNMHQSTNDTYPTAVKISIIKEIRKLADELVKLQTSLQEKETKYSDVLKLGRTQLMDAIPMLAGQMFGAHANAISRDRWRIYKSEERLRTINIGGTAIGTGLNAPREYTFMMTNLLKEHTSIGLARADSLIDNTQNLDVFVEVSGLLKTCASNLIKISNDYRFLASGPNGGIGEIHLEKRQLGSTIMPGKINPVILENTIIIASRVIANDVMITNLVSMGNLELNAFLPGIAEALLESTTILKNGVDKLNTYAVKPMTVNQEKCHENILKSHTLITPLLPYIGYEKAEMIVEKARNENKDLLHIIEQETDFTLEELKSILKPQNITKPGVVRRDSNVVK
jgi:aspartate ammonia-lyase